jgi:hypothetical protein
MEVVNNVLVALRRMKNIHFQNQRSQCFTQIIPSLWAVHEICFLVLERRSTMSFRTFRLLRIAFGIYLVCAGVLLIVKFIVLSDLWEDQEYLTGLILHPATGMMIGLPRKT